MKRTKYLEEIVDSEGWVRTDKNPEISWNENHYHKVLDAYDLTNESNRIIAFDEMNNFYDPLIDILRYKSKFYNSTSNDVDLQSFITEFDKEVFELYNYPSENSNEIENDWQTDFDYNMYNLTNENHKLIKNKLKIKFEEKLSNYHPNLIDYLFDLDYEDYYNSRLHPSENKTISCAHNDWYSSLPHIVAEMEDFSEREIDSEINNIMNYQPAGELYFE
tara:strand:+ start:19 stop:675 length:657 start_codon:yes stop_codon:yes gene_type:complete